MYQPGRDARKKLCIEHYARTDKKVLVSVRAFFLFVSSWLIDLKSKFKSLKSTLLYKGAIFAIATLFVPGSVLLFGLNSNIPASATTSFARRSYNASKEA
jgi:hypothetical protein